MCSPIGHWWLSLIDIGRLIDCLVDGLDYWAIEWLLCILFLCVVSGCVFQLEPGQRRARVHGSVGSGSYMIPVHSYGHCIAFTIYCTPSVWFSWIRISHFRIPLRIRNRVVYSVAICNLRTWLVLVTFSIWIYSHHWFVCCRLCALQSSPSWINIKDTSTQET